MSSHPAPKAGYTKSGKSLKAVRRYYALMNQKKKSPDEDKLSKRIAAELKTQQDANEKRSKRESAIPLMEESASDKPESPRLVLSPKETGPVFIAPTPTPTEQGAGIKSTAPKSIKSLRSTNTGRTFDCTAGTCSEGNCCSKMLYVMLGFLVGLPVGLFIRDGIAKLVKSNVSRNGTKSFY